MSLDLEEDDRRFLVDKYMARGFSKDEAIKHFYEVAKYCKR